MSFYSRRGRPTNAERAARLQAEQVHMEKVAQEESISIEERLERINERFTVLWNLANGVVKGVVRSMIVSGAPGVGKSHTINEVLGEAALKGKIKFKMIHGMVTPIHLYKLLYENRNAQDVIVLDDSDDVFKDETALNLLKAALDTSKRRHVSYFSESRLLKDEDIPCEFDYEGAIIFITNMDFQRYIDADRGNFARHFAALKDRSLYLDLKLHRAKDLVAWIQYMVTKRDILVQSADLSKDEQKMVLDFIGTNYEKISDLSIRTALKLAQFIKMDAKGWEATARMITFRS